MKTATLSMLVLALIVGLSLDVTGQGGRNRGGRGGGGGGGGGGAAKGGGGHGGGHHQRQATPSMSQQANRPSHNRASANMSFAGERNNNRADRRPSQNPGWAGGHGGGGGGRPEFANRPGAGGGGIQNPGILPQPGGGGGRPGAGNRPGAGDGGIQRPTPLPGGGGNRPDPGNRPGAGGGGVQRPLPLPGGGGTRPGAGGGVQRPFPRPGDDGRPDFANRPGAGGGGTQWPNYPNRPVRPDWGNRPNRPYRPDRPNINDIDSVVNNVGNVTNNTIINQNINNNVFNNFGNHYGDNWLNQNNYDNYGGYHSRPWSTRYDCLHTHWGGGYWNFRYQPQIWVNPTVPVTFGLPYVQYQFANPYIASSQTTYLTSYDYSQPVRVTTQDPSGAITEAAVRQFDAARAAFRNNNMQQCLQLVDSAIQLVPDDSVMHELRALALFALGDYETAATIVYSVLGGGPGSDWETIGALYADPQTYMRQLSNLSAYVAQNPNQTGPRFLLAYHLLVVGRPDAAYAQLNEIVQRNPQDQVSASLMQALSQPPAPDLAYAP